MAMASASKNRDNDNDKVRYIKKSDNKFKIGDQVEVSSDDEGFRGAWYAATILKSVSSLRSTKRSPAKAKAQAFVQYHNLLSDSDETKPLTEYVDASFIRPLPPPHDTDTTSTSFELLDVVDAFHRDGWWKGVVTKVSDDSDSETHFKKYTVIFENPPEQFQFSSTDLRFHWDWTDGTWVRPLKQKRMEGLKFSKGMAVEVNLDRDNLGDAWFPATVLEEVGFNLFLVECGSLRNDDENGHIKETVDSFHIRPSPPKLNIADFEILERVEVFHESGWRDALITKILTEGRYSVCLKPSNKEMQLSRSEIRPYLHLINGAWTNFTREILVDVQFEGQSAHTDSNAKDPEVAMSFESSSMVTDDTEKKSSCRKLSTAKDHIEEKLSCKRSRKNPLEQPRPCSAKSSSKRGKRTASKRKDTISCPSKKLKKENSVEPSSSEACLAEMIPFKTKNPKMRVASSVLTKYSTNDLDPSQQDTGLENEVTGSMENSERQMNSKTAGKTDKTKGDSAEILVEAEHVEKGANSFVPLVEGRRGSHAKPSHQHSNEVTNQRPKSSAIWQQKEGEQHNIARDGASEMDFKDYATKEAELSTIIGVEHGDFLIGTSTIVPLENHMEKEISTAAVVDSCNGLSTCFPGKRRREVENFMQSLVINDPGATELVESPQMPFLKSSSIWESIESLEVFQALPQKPHFSPLIDCKEASREGLAMGHMLTFATLMEKTSKLRADDPREVFSSYLEVLADLEMLGFDVKVVVDRLNKLLSIKDRRDQLEDRSRKVDAQITECNNEKTKLREDIDKTDKMISELEEQRAMKVSMKVMKDSEIIALQVDANVINEDIVNVRHEFESVATAAW